MRTLFLIILMVASLAGATACASGGASTSSGASSGNRDFLMRDEIDKAQWANSYEVVRSLRPQWLRVRGRDTITQDPGGIQVVLDDVRLGGIDVLRTLPVSGVAYLQFVDGISASQRWGTGFGNGAIVVSTRPR